jgi:TPR repeat protein
MGTIPAGGETTATFRFEVGIVETKRNFDYKLTFTSENTEPLKLDKSLTVNPLVTTGSLRRMDAASNRRKVLQMIHGQLPFEKDQFQLHLDKAVQENDALAKAWKAVLLREGNYGYAKNMEDAQTAARGVYVKVLDQVSTGNLEAAYLISKMLRFGLDCAAMKSQSRSLLELVAEKSYPLAQFDLGLLYVAEGNGQKGVAMLQKAADQNLSRATTVLGEIYEFGIGVSNDEERAFAMYKKAADRQDPAAMYHLGKMYLEGKGVRPDIDLAINWFEKAAGAGESRAMISMGSIYLDNIYGKPKDIKKGLGWYEKAAESGSAEGMFRLSVLYLSGDLGYQDINQVKYWVQKAAVEGHGKAAYLLSLFYIHPDVDPKDRDEVLGRFWQMEAKMAGEKVGSTGGDYLPGLEFLKHYNVYEYTTNYKDYYGNTYSTKSIDPFPGIFESLAIMGIKTMLPSGDHLNDAKFVYAKERRKVYAATLNAETETPVHLKKGQQFRIEGRGKIVFGMFAGSGTADGLTDPSLTTYNRVDHFPHGALMMRIGKDEDWRLSGRNQTFTASKDGVLYLAVNDKDAHNNQNYFDVKITVEDY